MQRAENLAARLQADCACRSGTRRRDKGLKAPRPQNQDRLGDPERWEAPQGHPREHGLVQVGLGFQVAGGSISPLGSNARLGH